jgi:alpha-tubulin suppressor-like RCC1 family protein
LANGAVYTCGLNEAFQLGHSADLESTAHVREVEELSSVLCVSAGHRHTVAVTRDGAVWSWGDNAQGQAGHPGLGGVVERPTRVEALRDVQAASCSAGARHTLVLATDGTVYAFGTRALLGLGASERWWVRSGSGEAMPRRIRVLSAVTAVFAGSRHSACIDESGQLFTWGENSFNLLGRAGSPAEPCVVGGLPAIHSVACGGLHTVAATTSGLVYAWGANQNGELGVEAQFAKQQRSPMLVPGLSGIARVSAGWRHTAALGVDGALFLWGWGGSDGADTGGQLGISNPCDFWSPMKVDMRTKAVMVSCGWNHTLGVFEA